MQNKNMLLKKAAGLFTVFMLFLSVCYVPVTGTAPVEETQLPLYTFDFDTDGLRVEATVDGTLTSGGSYRLIDVSANDGVGRALRISLSNDANRAIAFNNGSEWLTLSNGKYYITYDYMIEQNRDSGNSSLKFIKITDKSSFSAYLGSQGTPVGEDLIDFDAEKNVWHSAAVTLRLTDISTCYFGLRAQLKDTVYIDNIRIYSCVDDQPAVYDFDSHDFLDGIAQNDSSNITDGLSGEYYNGDDSFVLIENCSNGGVNAGEHYSSNSRFSNVVSVESGRSRSNTSDLAVGDDDGITAGTAGNAYYYSNSEQYPGLSGSGHNNVLRLGLNEYAGAKSDVSRTVLLNNGSKPLSLSAGNYKISFDYYVAGSASEQNTKLWLTHNVNNAVYTDGKYYVSSSSIADVRVFDINNGITTDAGQWIHREYNVTYEEDADNIGFLVSSLRSEAGTRAAEVFLDNISVIKIDDPGENTWNFDFGVNAADGSVNTGGGGTYAVGSCDAAAEGTDGNVLKFGHTAAYHGDERSVAFLSDGSAKHLESGVYNITFRYLFTKIEGDATYKEQLNSGYISDTTGRIYFGGINDYENFRGTVSGQLTALLEIHESSLTSGKTEGVWYTYTDRIKVSDENGIYFGLSSRLLRNTMYFDDITVEAVDGDIFDFDTGSNRNMTALYDSGKLIGGSGIYTIAGTETEQGRVLKAPADLNAYNGEKRSIIFNNGSAPARYSRGLYEVTFKYRYDLNSQPVNAESWQNNAAGINFVNLDEASIGTSNYASWQTKILTGISGSELNGDGAWHEITKSFYMDIDNGILGLEAEYLRGVFEIDDIIIRKTQCDYEKILSDDTYTVEGDIIKMPGSYIWISEFLDTVNYGNRMTVKNSDGIIIEDKDQPIATGYIVELSFYDIITGQTVVTDRKYVAVPNDLDGNGIMNILDLIRLKKLAAKDGAVVNDEFAQKGLYEAVIGGEANAYAVAKFNTALLNAPSNQHNVTVSGNGISGYVIVKPESCSPLWSEQVTRLARTIKKYTGYGIPIVTDTAVEGGKIIINAPDADEISSGFKLSAEGINLVVDGADDSSILAALNYITAAIENGGANLGNYTGEVTDLPYTLVYSDEFNGNALDASVWGNYTANPETRLSVFQIYDEATGQYITSSQASEITDHKVLQLDAEGVSVADGNLNISVSCSDPDNYKTATYTTHQPVTENRLNFRYGLLEIRAKLPAFPATTALWTTGSGLEIDLVEGSQKSDGSFGYRFAANVHMPAPDGGRRVAHSYERYSDRIYTTDVDLTADYHIYSVMWTPDIMKFAVDGNVFWTLDMNEFDPAGELADKTQFILMGASYCSSVDGDTMSPYINGAYAINQWVDNGNTMPSETSLMIDYVRLYQDNSISGNYFKIN